MRALMDNGDEEEEEAQLDAGPIQDTTQSRQPPPAQPSRGPQPDETAAASQAAAAQAAAAKQTAAAQGAATPRSASRNGARPSPADEQWWDDWGSAGGGGRSSQSQRQAGTGAGRGWGLPFSRRPSTNGAGAAQLDSVSAAQPAEGAAEPAEDGWDDVDGRPPDITALTPEERVRGSATAPARASCSYATAIVISGSMRAAIVLRHAQGIVRHVAAPAVPLSNCSRCPL